MVWLVQLRPDELRVAHLHWAAVKSWMFHEQIRSLRLSWNLIPDSVLFSFSPSQLWRQTCAVSAKTKVHKCFSINLSRVHLGRGQSLWSTRSLQEGRCRISGQRIQLVPLFFKNSPLTPTRRLSCKHPSLRSFTNWFSVLLKRRFKKNPAAGQHLAGLSDSWISTANCTGCTHAQIYSGRKESNIYLWKRKQEVQICISLWRRLNSPIGCPLIPTVDQKVCSH